MGSPLLNPSRTKGLWPVHTTRVFGEKRTAPFRSRVITVMGCPTHSPIEVIDPSPSKNCWSAGKQPPKMFWPRVAVSKPDTGRTITRLGKRSSDFKSRLNGKCSRKYGDIEPTHQSVNHCCRSSSSTGLRLSNTAICFLSFFSSRSG
jgi:hypothetical protein